MCVWLRISWQKNFDWELKVCLTIELKKNGSFGKNWMKGISCMDQIKKFVNWIVLDKSKHVDVLSVWNKYICSFWQIWVWLRKQNKYVISKISENRAYNRRIRNIGFPITSSCTIVRLSSTSLEEWKKHVVTHKVEFAWGNILKLKAFF